MWKIQLYSALTIVILFATSISAHACQLRDGSDVPQIILPPRTAPTKISDYTLGLMQLILEKSTPQFGPCEITVLDYKPSLARQEMLLDNQKIDVIALTSTPDRNKKFLPIRIPISKGLIGYRAILIHQEAEEKFSSIHNAYALSKLVAGQGYNWGDVKVLNKNHFRVMTGSNIETLMEMLAKKRFDYFPRGVLEIGNELNKYSQKPITVQKHLLLRYPNMSLFYVKKQNTALATRIAAGLEMAIEDGSFKNYFFGHPRYKLAKEYLALDKRKVIDLCNPIIPDWAPLTEDKYWLTPWPKKGKPHCL